MRFLKQKRVYDESLERYVKIYSEIKNSTDLIYSPENTSAVINSLSFERREWFKNDNKWYNVTVPPMGSIVLKDGKNLKSKKLRT